jgi:hypothetical protein
MNSNATQYEELAEQIESILQDPEAAIAQIRDENTRRRLVQGAGKLAICLEGPRETLRRFGYSVCGRQRVHDSKANPGHHQHLQLPLAIIGVETKLFSALVAEARPFHITELTDTTGVDKSLLGICSFPHLSQRAINSAQRGYCGTIRLLV